MAVANEPSVFKPLKFYCTLKGYKDSAQGTVSPFCTMSQTALNQKTCFKVYAANARKVIPMSYILLVADETI